jgi:anti-anti-sigma factor
MNPASDTFQATGHSLTVTAHLLPGEGGGAQVRLAGDIDLASDAVLSKTVDWLTARTPVSVVLDLADVTFACSALPNFVVQLYRAVPSATEMVLWRARPATGLVLRLTDIATIATIRDDPTYDVPV